MVSAVSRDVVRVTLLGEVRGEEGRLGDRTVVIHETEERAMERAILSLEEKVDVIGQVCLKVSSVLGVGAFVCLTVSLWMDDGTSASSVVPTVSKAATCVFASCLLMAAWRLHALLGG